MKSYVYLQVNSQVDDILLDKIIELGYFATSIFRSNTFHIYRVEMSDEDLVILKLTIPLLEIDNIGEPDGTDNP